MEDPRLFGVMARIMARNDSHFPEMVQILLAKIWRLPFTVLSRQPHHFYGASNEFADRRRRYPLADLEGALFAFKIGPGMAPPFTAIRPRLALAGATNTSHDGGVQISARGDYAVRASLELAAAYPSTLSAQSLADAQGLPRKFLEAILADLRRSGVLHAVRGAEGGYILSLPPGEITIGMVLRAVDGPLAGVRGHRPEQTSYTGTAIHLPQLWVAVRAALRSVVDEVSLSELVAGELPARVHELTKGPDAWQPR